MPLPDIGRRSVLVAAAAAAPVALGLSAPASAAPPPRPPPLPRRAPSGSRARPPRRRRPRPERPRLRPVHRGHPGQAGRGLHTAGVRPVRHRPLRAAVQAGHVQRPQRPTRLLHLDRRASACSPDDTTINGDVTVDAGWFNGNATQNFWRSAENLALVPVNGTNRWAVAQAAPFRRMHVRGGLNLAPTGYGWASGGYIADSRIDGQVGPYSQQQWYTRDSADRQLAQRRLEHGVLRRARAPPRRASRTRRTPRSTPPRSPGRSPSST